VITVVKEMAYRDNPNEEWSNTYGFGGPTPPDSASWHALLNELAAVEKTVYLQTCKIVGAYGYIGWPSKDNHAVWGIDLRVAPNSPIPGTYVPTGTDVMAGDQAAWIRWHVDRRTSNGKPVYLRKYYHHGAVNPPDGLEAGLVAALENLGQKLQDGSWSTTGYGPIYDPGDAPVLAHGVSPFVTTRTLKRRGKRPLAGGAARGSATPQPAV